jgi:diguanylate cyclase (GGDEF)-like protein/PAS domain S-box-containing protein
MMSPLRSAKSDGALEPAAQTESSPVNEQLYRYAEDLHHLLDEHKSLQTRFRSLEASHRALAEYRDLVTTLVSSSDAGRVAAQLEAAGENILNLVRPEARSEVETWLQAIFTTDLEGRILTVNPAFSRITGYSADEIIGQNIGVMHPNMQDDRFFGTFWRQLAITGSWQGELQNRRKNGETYPQWLVMNATRDEHGKILNYVGIFHDLTRLHDAERQLSHLAYHDVLTDLPNRQLFADRLRLAIFNARRNHSRLAVLFIDLDRFKLINESLGHEVGDALLKEVATRLRQVTRDTDTVSRPGGDEFTLILPELPDVQDAETVAGKILGIFQQPFHIGYHDIYVTPSIGIALFPEHGNDDSMLVRHADAAMYQAKADGGNTFNVFAGDNGGFTHDISMECAIREAVLHNELYLMYQPQVSSDGTELIGVEALARWRHPEFGEVWPSVFIPMAERNGAIMEIGDWVLRTACAQMAAWRAAGFGDFRMAVNVSPRQLRDPHYPQKVFAALNEAGLPGSALELEITEGELLSHPDSTLLKLYELRNHGISIAIDDFGTGYSSLARLRSLPIDRLKVDRSFVTDLDSSSDARGISACIVALGKVMNLHVLAEGVENDTQRGHLVAQGCHSIQGYFYSRPLHPEQLPAWKEDNKLR